MGRKRLHESLTDICYGLGFELECLYQILPNDSDLQAGYPDRRYASQIGRASQ